MYCPLCMAEYRAGFDKCSDCLVHLLSTIEEARSVSVSLLWSGASQSTLNVVVDALRDANIPLLARSTANSEGFFSKRPTVWHRIPYVGTVRRIYDQMSWEVLVLTSDYERAQGIVHDLTH